MNRTRVIIAVAVAVVIVLGVSLGLVFSGSQSPLYPGYPESPASSPSAHPAMPASSPVGHTAIPAAPPKGNGVMKAPSATRYSYNWLGYVASKGTGAFSSVRANWIEPGINCHNIWAEDGQWQIESTWVGLDGWGDSTVEQTGTSGQCYDGTSSHYAWYEMYPAGTVILSGTVLPGDAMLAQVLRYGNWYELIFDNETLGWTETVWQYGVNQDSSAEAVVEAPYDGGILPLANFGNDYFTGTQMNGESAAAEGAQPMDMVNASDTYYLGTVSPMVTPRGLPATHARWSAHWDWFN